MTLPDVAASAVELFCVEAEALYSNGDKDGWSEKRDEARELLDSAGFTYLGVGDYRVVYGFPDGKHVLKLAKNKLGRSENQSELQNWERASTDARQWLATLYKWDTNGKWMIQERIDTPVSTDEAARVQTKLQEHGLHISEIDAFNVGRTLDGQLVAFDYAGT